ncbi:MAG: hypothetical protein ACRC5D_15240 [Aeromonas allosaccharophila]
MKGRGCKEKGAKFERELADWFNSNVYGRDSAYRAPLSGGGGGVNERMTGGADLVGTPLIHVEAKRVERLNFLEAMAQAERSLARSGGPEVPVVINRRNRMTTDDSLVVMRLKHWRILYLALLQLEGIHHV